MSEAVAMIIGVGMGWFAAMTSGALFSYVVFRTKKEQHERLFPENKKPRHYGKPITRDEFAFDEDEEGLPDVVRKMNERVASELAMSALKGGKNG